MEQLLMLPEILEVVFSHLNGKSLVLAEQVCKLWREVAQNITKVCISHNEKMFIII